FQAPFTALILEPGAHLAAFHLTVAVIGMGHPQTRPLKPGQRLPVLAAQIPAALLHIDIGSTMVVVIMIMIMVMPMPAAMPVGPMGVAIGMFMGQQAVFAVLLTVGQAKKAPLANPAEPQRGGVRFVERPVLPRWTAGNVVGVRVQPAALQPQGKLTRTGGHPEGTRTLI